MADSANDHALESTEARPSLEEMISAWAGARWDPAIYELPQEEAPSSGELVASVDGPRPREQDPADAALLRGVQDRPVAPGGQRGSVEGGPPTSTAAAISTPSAATEAA